MSDAAAQALPWIAVTAILLTLAASAAVLRTRSLVSACLGVAALCACAAGALLALDHGEGALAVALFGVGVAPVLLLGGVLLSSRAVKPRGRALPWLSILAAVAAAAAMLWAAPTIDATQAIAPRSELPVALFAIVFVAVAACGALLGYGERGVLGAGRGGPSG
jgi:hypothetical protein